MGTRGPVPNRSEDLARDRSRKGGEQREVTKGEMRDVSIPEPDGDWHPIALMVWESLAQSGQSDFYQQSDWAFAYNLCEELSLYKKPRTYADGTEYHKRSPEMLKGLLSAMSALLMTEADRRRVRIELQQPEPEETPARVLAIADYQAGLGVGPSQEDDEQDDDDAS